MPALLVLGVALSLAAPGSPRAQEPAPDDSLAVADTVAPADTLDLLVVGADPRLTWLGDTLAPRDTIAPKFSNLPEVFPDSLVHIYTVDRPGRWAAWRIPGTALLGRGAFSLLDVLESEHPVLAQDLGGSGLPAFVGSPHGTGTNVQVVIDGVPAGTALTAAWDLRQLPLEAIEEVTWYPGPQVAAWGGSGTGGVLAITTRRSLVPGARSLLAFLMGSTDAQAFSGSFGRSMFGRGDLFVGANFDAIEGVGRGDFTRNQTFARVGWRLGSHHRIEVARRGDGLAGRVARPDVAGSEDHNTAAIHLFYVGGWGPLSARLHGQREKHEIGEAFRYAGVDAITGRGEKSEVRGDVAARLGDRGVAWAGGARVDEDAGSTAPVFFSDTTNLLEGPTDAVEPIAPRVTTEVAGGAGWGGPADVLALNGAVRRIAFDETIDGGVAWQLEALARPGAGLTIRAAAGSAIRAADFIGYALLARLADQGLEIRPGRLADPSVTERWTEWRGEIAWRDDSWRAALQAWRARGEDAFLWLPPTAWVRFDPTSTDFPIGTIGLNAFDVVDMTATGVEADVAIPLPYGVQGMLRGRWLDETVDVTGERVPYVPEIQALGQLRYAGRFFPSRDLLVEARLSGRFLGSRTALGGEELPATLVGDLLVQATVINLTVFVSLKNLTDQEIETEPGLDLPGFEGFVGINWRFRD
jgi:hypothetical protein